MSIELLTNNHRRVFEEVVSETKTNIRIVSPFIGGTITRKLAQIRQKNDIKIQLITRYSERDFVSGASDFEKLHELVSFGVEAFAIDGLHTKLYLFDKETAIVGSANLTDGGFCRNTELSMIIRDEKNILQELFDYYESLLSAAKDYPISSRKMEKDKLRINSAKESHKGNLTDLANFNKQKYGGKWGHINNDIISIHDDITFINMRTACNFCFGGRGNGIKYDETLKDGQMRKHFIPPALRKEYGEKYYAWFITNKKGWINELGSNGSEIVYYNEDKDITDKDVQAHLEVGNKLLKPRITFIKDSEGLFHFIGVFEFEKITRDKRIKMKRVSTSFPRIK